MAATIKDFEERIEKQKAELAKLEARKKELEKKIRERNRKWRSAVLMAVGEDALKAAGCSWDELDVHALADFFSIHAEELKELAVVTGSTPEEAKARLDAHTKKPAKSAKEEESAPASTDGGEPNIW